MKIKVPGPFLENLHVLMQRAGYSPHPGKSDELSYYKRVSRDFYPRYHLYPEISGADIILSLHVDMKKNTYEGFARHQGEYDSPIVEREMNRIVAYLESQRDNGEKKENQKEQPNKKGFFEKLFG